MHRYLFWNLSSWRLSGPWFQPILCLEWVNLWRLPSVCSLLSALSLFPSTFLFLSSFSLQLSDCVPHLYFNVSLGHIAKVSLLQGHKYRHLYNYSLWTVVSIDNYIIPLPSRIKLAKEKMWEEVLLCHLKCGQKVKNKRQNSKISHGNRHTRWLFQNGTEALSRRVRVRINSSCNHRCCKLLHLCLYEFFREFASLLIFLRWH